MRNRLSFVGVAVLSFVVGRSTYRWQQAAAQVDDPAAEHEKWTPSLRGDVNADGVLDISDAIFIIDYCFRGGTRPEPLPGGRLPATMQLHCWSGARGELQDPCPPRGADDFGQDANFKTGTPRSFELIKENEADESTWYTIDHATGLMWQYSDDGVRRTWREALAAAAELDLGGFTDWRMPNIMELFSIVDISSAEPSVNRDFFRITPTAYWSSSTCVHDPSRAYTVRFNHGIVACTDKGGQGQGSTRIPSVFVRTLE